MENVKEIFDGLSHIVFGTAIIATVFVRLTPTKSDDEKLDQLLKKIHKFMAILPTFGINPRTKELEKK